MLDLISGQSTGAKHADLAPDAGEAAVARLDHFRHAKGGTNTASLRLEMQKAMQKAMKKAMCGDSKDNAKGNAEGNAEVNVW